MTELQPPLVDDDPEPSVSRLDPRPWLIDAADLLGEPDPGPIRWLVDGLIPAGAIGFAVGRWKTTKSYGLLELAISIATGRPAFGVLEIPEPGGVIFVNEESGRAATWRRLDALCRGRAIDPEELRGRLHVSANARLKLDDPDWLTRLLELGAELQPSLFIFDPLARMKSATRDENSQGEMAVIIENLRQLREETGAAVLAVHHVGHAGGNMRGSSDLETAWETRLTWKRDDQALTVTIENEHREAESAPPLSYRIAWDAATRSMRFNGTLDSTPGVPPLEQRIVEWLHDHPNQTTDEVAKGVETRKADVLQALTRLETGTNHGTTHRGPSGRRDRAGRAIRDKVWNLTTQAGLWPVPDSGTTRPSHDAGHRGSVPVPVPIGTGRTEQPPDDPHETDYSELWERPIEETAP